MCLLLVNVFLAENLNVSLLGGERTPRRMKNPAKGFRVFPRFFAFSEVFSTFSGGAPFFPKKTKFSFRVFWVGPELLVSLLLEPKRFLLALWFHTRTASVPRVNLPIVRTPPEKQKLWNQNFWGFPQIKTKKKHPNLRNLFLLWDFLFGGVLLGVEVFLKNYNVLLASFSFLASQNALTALRIEWTSRSSVAFWVAAFLESSQFAFLMDEISHFHKNFTHLSR